MSVCTTLYMPLHDTVYDPQFIDFLYPGCYCNFKEGAYVSDRTLMPLPHMLIDEAVSCYLQRETSLQLLLNAELTVRLIFLAWVATLQFLHKSRLQLFHGDHCIGVSLTCQDMTSMQVCGRSHGE